MVLCKENEETKHISMQRVKKEMRAFFPFKEWNINIQKYILIFKFLVMLSEPCDEFNIPYM